MLSGNQQKLIRSLQQKKQREIHGMFLIEGNTIISDLIRSGELHVGNLVLLAATPEWLDRAAPALTRLTKKALSSDPGELKKRSGLADVAVPADPAELKKLSGLMTPPEVMAVVRMPSSILSSEPSSKLSSEPSSEPLSEPSSKLSSEPSSESSSELSSEPSSKLSSEPSSESSSELSSAPFRPEQLREGLSLVFESIRDPGNLGTIIRTADWFGIRNIFCSPDSVDTYNNKVIQASMGAVMRISPVYIELPALFEEAGRFKIPVYGTTMDGNDFYDTPVKMPGLIVFGNESHGISALLEPYFRQKIRIPDFPAGASATESLNVATSVAVVCAEIRRRQR